MPGEPLEISDLIVDYDLETLQPRAVRQAEVLARLEANGQRSAARIVRRIPAPDGVLDAAHCGALLLRAHTELQRLSEEFLQADRLRAVLLPLLHALRELKVAPPLRVIDVGCGLGYAVRALAAHGRLGRDVELVGCDMNATLVDHARRLAEQESLSCELRVANAFRLEQPGHVFISTGVAHHFRGGQLAEFFAGQRPGWAFVHFDVQASALSPLGSWIFHQSRMREPLARHDGVASARRAHPAASLLQAAATTDFRCALLDDAGTLLGVVLRPMVGVIGVRRELWEAFVHHLGPIAPRLSSAP